MPTTDSSCEPAALTPEQKGLVRHHLQEVISSHAFAGSKRTQDFLHLIVDHALEGDIDRLRERMIGAEMFGRPVGYDTGNDSVVRVKATEVRKKLAEYYLETDNKHPVHIELPRGSYVPRFIFDTSPTATHETNVGSLPHVEQSPAQIDKPSPETAAVRAATPTPSASVPRRSPRILIGV